MTEHDAEIVAVKAELRERGWFVRYTEWPSGHQVVLHRRRDTAVHLVTAWHASEVEAWREALALAVGAEETDVQGIGPVLGTASLDPGP